MGNRRTRSAGFTLLEMALATLVVLVVLAVGVSLAGQASATWHNVYHDTNAVHQARNGLAALADELRQSRSAAINLDHTDPDADALTYQVPVGRFGATVQWGAAAEEGWRLQVRVEDGRLQRLVLDEAGLPQGRSTTLATNVDGLYDGLKGFSVSVNSDLYTVSLRTRAESQGRTWRKTVSTTVWVRNGTL